MKLTLNGVKRYSLHSGFLSVIQNKSGWNIEKLRDFLSKNDTIVFNSIDAYEITDILQALEAAGFENLAQQTKDGVIASVMLSRHQEIELLKQQVAEISRRLESLQTTDEIHKTEQKPFVVKTPMPVVENREQIVEEPVKIAAAETSAEGNIGKYWLSRIGVFTLILGVVLFISYSFQFIGPAGKIFMGLALGALLVGGGNYFTRLEKYRSWAMSAIGGGWAIIFFSVYAAYAIPATKIIGNPITAILGLFFVSLASITQSLKFRSGVMVVFSYFLAYLAITMISISYFTLTASLMLAVSLVIVTHKMEWRWLGLMGLCTVYVVHFAWLEPILYGFRNSGTNIIDILALPWTGNQWRLHPLIAAQHSIIHQCFLILYWMLFTAIGFFKKGKNVEDENYDLISLLLNGLVFNASYVYHLHVYYPKLQFIFPLAMGGIYAFLSVMESHLKRSTLSDLYLAFCVSLLCLAVPMYFDGFWITYGWSAAAPLIAWIGIRRNRRILMIIAWILAGIVACRLYWIDYAERGILFHAVVPVRAAFFLFLAGSASFYSLFKIYQNADALPSKERNIVRNIALLSAAATFGLAFLFGGLRSAVSVLWIAEGALLMMWSVSKNNLPARVMACIFFLLSAIRLVSVDYALEILRMKSDLTTGLRLLAAAASVFAVFCLAHWMRKQKAPADVFKISNIMIMVGAFLVLAFFMDSGISSWISIIWGVLAFVFVTIGFTLKDKIYRWCGLGMFAAVVLRLFVHDFSKLETIYRIISFIGIGAVFIAASFLYSYYSKVFLVEKK